MAPEAVVAESASVPTARSESLIPYFLVGCYLGIIFIKSEVASWFRIQEMFRFQAFHMYGVIGGAVVVATLGVLVLKRLGTHSVLGDEIVFPDPTDRSPSPQHVLGGITFGLGWGLLGACPGPIYALLGTGLPVMLFGLGGALAGVWVYGWLRPQLPH